MEKKIIDELLAIKYPNTNDVFLKEKNIIQKTPQVETFAKP